MKKLKITVNGKEYEVEVEVLEDSEQGSVPPMPYPAYQQSVSPVAAAPAVSAPIPPKPKAAPASGDSNQLTSPMNGVVIEIPAAVGQTVKEGQVVVVLEAMKMKTNIVSSRDGVIASVAIKINDTVEAGQVLLSYE